MRILLRAMEFEDLQKLFFEGDEEGMPDHMRAHQASWVFTGNILDRNATGSVKFPGKNSKNGRFQARVVPDDVRSQSKNMWQEGPCPHEDDPAYCTFNVVMTTPIKKMSQAMLILAIGIHLECVHPGTANMCRHIVAYV